MPYIFLVTIYFIFIVSTLKKSWKRGENFESNIVGCGHWPLRAENNAERLTETRKTRNVILSPQPALRKHRRPKRKYGS
jgi:hypothetical protein